MNAYKQYLFKLRELALKQPYIIIKDDIVPKLIHYIKMLEDIAFDESSYHTYYGEIKTIVNSFNINWTDVMDEAIKDADRCRHCMNLAELTAMAERTIFMHQVKQADFEDKFRPISSTLEKQAFDDIEEKYKNFMNKLKELKESLKRLDKQEKIDAFAEEHFAFSLNRKNGVFVFTYNYISYQLSLYVDRIRVSIEEIFNRLRNNLRDMQEQSEINVSNLLVQLYEKNKEHLILSRQDIRASVELAEVQRSMDIIKDKIEDSKHVPMQRLQEECKYWEDRLREFNQIEKTIKELQKEENNLIEQKNLFDSMKDTAIPAPKRKCWEMMDENFNKKFEEINDLKLKAAKALLTFFSVRGPDRIFYANNIGTYYVDDFGHQCYVFDYGLCVFQVNCEGDLVEIPDKDKYLYDNMGRFYMDNDNPKQKLYQIAPCSSSYRLENDVFVKHTKDCGHSEKVNEDCCMLIKDPTDVIILPKTEPLDIKGTLEPEVVNYIWDTFGHILPDVLKDVADTNPKNPIHCLAHKLLVHKYKRTDKENEEKKREADMYRKKIHQDRIRKANTTYEAWKAKQTKLRKPDADDVAENSAYNAHVLQQEFIGYLNYYNT